MGKIITAKSRTKSPKEIIPGGRAKGKSPKDFDPKQIAMGIKVELEHTGDRDMAREIAMDHLAEIPDYYTRLLKMESRAKVAIVFPTQKALDKYLKLHPNADPKNHSVEELQEDRDFDASPEWENQYSFSTESGSIIAGTPHASDDSDESDESLGWVKKRLIPEISKQVANAIKAGKSVTFLAEGGVKGPAGSEQRMLADSLEKKFKEKVNQDTWDDSEVEIVAYDESEDVDVVDTKSTLFKKMLKEFDGKKDEVEASIYAFMSGQGSAMKITPAIKRGLKKLNLPEANSDEDIEALYKASFPEDFDEDETLTSIIGKYYNRARQDNLKDKIKKIEESGGVAIVAPGYSHVNALRGMSKKSSILSPNTNSNWSNKRVEFRGMYSRAKVANAPPELISQRKFQSANAKVYLFLTLYANRQYLIRVDVSRSVGFRLLASGPKAASAFRSLGDLILKGEDLYSSGFTESPASPAETESLFRSVTQGKFAVQFPTEDNDPESDDFFGYFKQYLREWTLNGSGNDKKLPILHHPYWERYLQSLHDSLRSKHGSSVTLYRGVHGDFVDEIHDIAPVYRFSSWTADKAIAKDFARYGFVGDLQSGFAEKVKRRGKWAVISTKVPIESIIMAPVFVEALKEPELLVKQLARQDEYVVDSPNLGVRVRVVSRSQA